MTVFKLNGMRMKNVTLTSEAPRLLAAPVVLRPVQIGYHVKEKVQVNVHLLIVNSSTHVWINHILLLYIIPLSSYVFEGYIKKQYLYCAPAGLNFNTGTPCKVDERKACGGIEKCWGTSDCEAKCNNRYVCKAYVLSQTSFTGYTLFNTTSCNSNSVWSTFLKPYSQGMF